MLVRIRSSNLCFTGDTVVATADGRNGVTIKQLAEESKGEKKPDYYDIKLIDAFESYRTFKYIPNENLIPGIKTIEPIRLGLTHVHHFYTKEFYLLSINILKILKRYLYMINNS